jgi:hypothetical protein
MYRSRVALLLASFALSAAVAQASEKAPERGSPVASPATGPGNTAQWRHGGYFHLYAESGVGRGLRFNNPYRLQTELGSNAQSLSLSAFYLDLAPGVLLGTPGGVQYGAALHASFALQGIQQEVLTPSYVMLFPLSARWQLRGRVGLPIVLEPDASVGVEASAGAVWLITAGIGVSADLIGSLFPGADTLQQTGTVIPILSAQLGLVLNYEVLP